ncbi:ATP-binding protein [Streptomyces sp. S3(2020)]|nr:ATP-binding protein [Streptomyces sp. S3(2020)]
MNPRLRPQIALIGGPVEARRTGTSGDRTTAGSGTNRTAPKRRRRTVIGCTTTGDTTRVLASSGQQAFLEGSANPDVDPAVVHSLANREWVKKGLPLCLFGDFGTRKSHLMIAFGTEAARHGRVDLLRIDLSRHCDHAGNGTRLAHNRTVLPPVYGNPGARSGLE